MHLGSLSLQQFFSVLFNGVHVSQVYIHRIIVLVLFLWSSVVLFGHSWSVTLSFFLFTLLCWKIELSFVDFPEGCDSFFVKVFQLQKILFVPSIHFLYSLADVTTIKRDLLSWLVHWEVVLAVDGADNWMCFHFDGLIQVYFVWDVGKRVAEANFFKLCWESTIFLLQKLDFLRFCKIILLKVLQISSNFHHFFMHWFNQVFLLL